MSGRDIISDITTILAFLLALVLLAGAAAACLPPEVPRGGTWVHVTPPAGSPFTGCAVQTHGGAVCWTTQEELEAP